MEVLKFGGTSVGKPERMHAVAKLITSNDNKKIVVLSAVSGTTNSLVSIGENLYHKEKSKALGEIEKLHEQYIEFLDALYQSEKGKKKGAEIIKKQFEIIFRMVEKSFTDLEERILLAQGELISTQLFQVYLEELGIDSKLIFALDFMSVDEDHEPCIDSISENLQAILSENKSPIYITQGYICRNSNGEVDNLRRGGSDYTATIIGAASESTEVQIWTDIDGMHNNDPRIVDNTFPIRSLSYDEAAELAYFGAKILHPFTVRPVIEKDIPVRLLNTMKPDAPGTNISKNTGDQPIKAIAAKDNITAIKIKSGRMLNAYGFLRKVFEIFEKYKTPIDMIATSEVAVSLTIDDDENLKDILKELSHFGTVEADAEHSIVCIVGGFVQQNKGVVRKIFDALEHIQIRMISYGGSKNNISLLIDTSEKEEALKLLNSELF